MALAAAFLLLAGTVGATMSLIDRLAGESTAGGQTAWDRAQVLDIERTDAGVTITLERAWVDVNQVLVGFTVEGIEAPSLTAEQPPTITWTAELRDPTGRRDYEWAPTAGGAGDVAADTGAVLMSWLGSPPQVAGTWELTVRSVGYGGGDGFVPGACTEPTSDECVDPAAERVVEGTWRFAFDLPAPIGTVVSTDVQDTVDDATVTLSELRIAPTTISGRLALRIRDTRVTEWQSTAWTVRNGETSYSIVSAYHVTQDPADQGPLGDEIEFGTSAGSDDTTGTWNIDIPALTYNGAAGTELTGPWSLSVPLE
jgi:hypothetical protein